MPRGLLIIIMIMRIQLKIAQPSATTKPVIQTPVRGLLRNNSVNRKTEAPELKQTRKNPEFSFKYTDKNINRTELFLFEFTFSSTLKDRVRFI